MKRAVFFSMNQHRHILQWRDRAMHCALILAGMLGLLLIGVPGRIILAQTRPGGTQAYSAMRWRLVGPFRAGWASVAVGVPAKPNTFYFGAVDGGVWKTTDAGRTWQPLMQHEKAASVGALDVSLSNPDILYVGTGQVTMRYDIVAGNGVYRSGDAGKTWKHLGLAETRHIGRILIDPQNPNRVLVAAMGHAFDSNPERGVYLTTDGGKSWRHTLFVNDQTGAVDLARDPEHPSIVYAALWQFRLHPWLDYFQPQVGPGSGIYKSEDGGEHWQRLSGQGLPAGPLGRIGLATPQGSAGRIVYATVVAPRGGSGFYRSNDGGRSWQLVNKDPELASAYFSRVTAPPWRDNPEVVYVMARSIHRSNDGGRHFTIVKGSPGGDDYHFLWINPSDPSHMIAAADQGTAVTVNGGASWSSWYNQPTGQFYHLAVDNRFPYHIYSGQQDNGTVEIASRGSYGVIEERDWHPVGGDERDYEVPKPGNPNIVFGSGLGGYISRADEVTRQVANVSPWPVSSYGARPTTVRYRYTWISPIVFSPLGSHPLYFAAQVLFRSLDDGDHWQTVSPDLSGKNPNVQDCKNPDVDRARDCGYGVIYTIAPSPVSEDVIWVGTDDGLIQLTTDGGKNWSNVTPATVPKWGRIDAIAPSPFSPRGAYVAVDMHRIDNFTPLILKTSDNGRSWQTITTGLPADQFVFVVRADLEREGLLYAGTNRGVYLSFDDGRQWQPLSLNLPTTSVRDLLVHQGDLIAATQGRGIWVLDDLEPLREMTPELVSKPVHLFHPAPAWRMQANKNHDTPPPPSTPLGQNPPSGAVIDYWLKTPVDGLVTMTVRDSAGNIIRRFSSDEKPKTLSANRYFQTGWLGKQKRLSSDAGMHRFVWDLRYPRPAALRYNYSIAAVWHDGAPLDPRGPVVLPGRYTVTLTVDGKDYTRPLVVKLDPRVHISWEALQQQLQLAKAINAVLNQVISTYRSVTGALENEKKGHAPTARIDSLAALANQGHPSLASVAGVLTSLANAVQSADAAPTQGQQAVFSQYRRQFNALLDRWHQIEGILKEKDSRD